LWAHNSEVTGSKPVAGIYHTSHRCIKALEQHFTGMAQRQRAGLITPRSQDRNLLPVSKHSPALQKLVVKLDVKGSTQYHRHGAEAARGAHNPEVTGSKPVAGIHHTSHWCIKALEHLITDMAQRQRARLITARTQDRNLLSVFITHRIGASRHWSILSPSHYMRMGSGNVVP